MALFWKFRPNDFGSVVFNSCYNSSSWSSARRDNTVKQGVKFTFAPELIKGPITYNLGQRFKVATNICRADINGDKGWVVLELQGKEKDVERGIACVNSKGV